MPRIAVEDNSRMSLRIRAEEKALLFLGGHPKPASQGHLKTGQL
jgi:hypothetical protein